VALQKLGETKPPRDQDDASASASAYAAAVPPQSPPAHSIQPSNPREVRGVVLPPHDDDGVLDVAIDDPVSQKEFEVLNVQSRHGMGWGGARTGVHDEDSGRRRRRRRTPPPHPHLGDPPVKRTAVGGGRGRGRDGRGGRAVVGREIRTVAVGRRSDYGHGHVLRDDGAILQCGRVEEVIRVDVDVHDVEGGQCGEGEAGYQCRSPLVLRGLLAIIARFRGVRRRSIGHDSVFY